MLSEQSKPRYTGIMKKRSSDEVKRVVAAENTATSFLT